MNKNGINRMWAKIKYFFGFCTEKRAIEKEIKRVVDVTYKKEPMVVEIKTPSQDKILPKVKAKIKKHYHYYNNGKKNLRIYEGDKIPEGFVKGIKHRKKKGDR